MRLLSMSILSMLVINSHANVIQYFAGVSYNNASELFKIKKNFFMVGSTGSYADLNFKGSVLNFNTMEYGYGTNSSRTYTPLPYGRAAKRLNEKAVFAVDVTEPFNSNLNWGNQAFTRYANTQNYLTDVDVSPKLSFALGKQWQVGGGINFNFLTNNEVNWFFPTGPFTADNLVNKSSSFGVGYNLGITYIINQTNFLGATYYSRIRQNTKGTSRLGITLSNNYLFSFYMPATTVVSYTHIFNPKWLINLQLFQSEWNVNQQVRLFNTAAPPPMSNFVFDMNFSASYAYLAAVRTQFTEKLGLALAGMIDDGPEKDHLRTITFPSDTQYFIGLMGDYHFNDKTTVELLYGHVYSPTSIQNTVLINNTRIPFTTGQVIIHANILDLRLKVEF